MSAEPDSRVMPVILSGGAGTRLWPLSRRGRPKQMLDLTGGGTMLALTAARVADAGLFAPPVIVAGAGQAEAIEAELRGIGALILEPVARNTAPAIALAALACAPESLLLVLPSDHLVRDAEGFRDGVRRGLPFARDGWIVTFGMKPERAETGYGYIERGPALGEGVHRAVRFVEKPDAATAAAFVAGGALRLERRHLPDARRHLSRRARRARADIGQRPRRRWPARARRAARILPDAAAFAASPAESIDYAVMEKAGKVAVVPVSIGWSDIGSWEALLDAVSDRRRRRQCRGRRRARDRRARQPDPLGRAAGRRDRGRGSGDRSRPRTRCWSCRGRRASGSRRPSRR